MTLSINYENFPKFIISLGLLLLLLGLIWYVGYAWVLDEQSGFIQ